MPTLLVIEDHPLYRRALADLARSLDATNVVREAHSLESALQLAPGGAAFDLLLVDFRLPGKSGAEALRLLREHYPRAALIVVSASEDRREVAAALRAGAVAFLSKSAPMEHTAQAITAALEGRPLAGLGGLGGLGGLAREPVQSDVAALLTPRQLEILALLCEGLSNKEISLRLGVALVTVKTHVAAIFKVLGVVSRTQAVLAARRLGLG